MGNDDDGEVLDLGDLLFLISLDGVLLLFFFDKDDVESDGNRVFFPRFLVLGSC